MFGHFELPTFYMNALVQMPDHGGLKAEDLQKPEKVFTREEIMNKVWGTLVVVGDRTIDVHIRKLREKIGEKYIKTIKGVGYKFEN